MGSLFAATAVLIGAFGAHGLKAMVSPESLQTFETAVRYHFYHALGIMAVAALLHFGRKKSLVFAGWSFAIGIILFSGSLYLLSTRDVTNLSLAWLGPITPIGGLFFAAGWGLLFFSSFVHYERHYKQEK